MGVLEVRSIDSDLPEASDVLRQGDVLYEVDGVNVYGKSIGFVFNLVKGKPGTKVDLTFKRFNDDNPYDQEYIRTTLTRRARAEGSQNPPPGFVSTIKDHSKSSKRAMDEDIIVSTKTTSQIVFPFTPSKSGAQVRLGTSLATSEEQQEPKLQARRMSKEELETEEKIKRNVGGIGISVMVTGKPPHRLVVNHVAQDMPAAQSGIIRVGDVLVEVNGVEMQGLSPDQACGAA
ncbi:hypothetical protein GUITHDRAFT_103790 [Guillardia theta CCMP2712]|uniref:PDZ domain-containing protein n=1 Tax=Guillardia theta (strain CCMP2712) TaxID=905079 RepID=L1JR46_GUITC|nr:hypothetical protein GUITHDRAFT_103790 [Guillardia theta CCMP2712]EKX50563.1 hypothetical protein GUITHDRAFT_103790 [Guillardia theta CCMP2712]|eukprot:XP_005837543.1 hypothetical protein GUITHDRAFT_103790 [Guillardia theta CCMP2712]